MDRIEFGDEVEVQLDVFSGRPNPRWTLSGERVRELERRLDALEPAEWLEPPGLGYRGLLVIGPGVEVRAFNSVLAATRGGRTSSFRDSAGLEEHLLKEAREHGFAELLAAVGQKGSDAPG